MKDKKYHFDELINDFYVDNSMPFNNKIHPKLRHLHKNSTKLKCNVCGFLGFAQIHQDCISIKSNGEKCNGLMCGF